MTIDLMQFCGTDDDPRLWLQRPFGIGDYTYAANGHILVRVPRSDWPSADLPSEVLPASFPQVLEWLDGSPAMAPIPAIPPGPYYEKCFWCAGSGELQYDCCGDHIGECNECEECEGDGVTEKKTYYRFGSRSFNARYLRMIKALPASQLAIDGPKMDGALFTFSGGRGVVMPVSEDKGPYPELKP